MAHRDFSEWQGKDLIDRDGERIGKLEDVYFDVSTDQPQFGLVKEGLIGGRHLTFVPLTQVTIGPDFLQAAVSKAQVKTRPTRRSTTTDCRRPTSPLSTTTTS